MRRCAFLTTDALDGFVHDDALAREPLARLGWEVEDVPWRHAVDWRRYEAAVLRTTWDYHQDLEAFLAVLERIVAVGVRLANPLPLVRWNARKTYLRALRERGVPIVPSHFGEALAPGGVAQLFDELGSAEIVVKPVVGANSQDTWRLRRDTEVAQVRRVEAAFRDRAWVAQPFQTRILTEGELSVVCFRGKPSHALRKTPGRGDFRTQEEHGAELRPVGPEPALLAAARRALSAAGGDPLYARVDLVPGDDGELLLMELELIEPSLYLRLDPEAPERFARALAAWLRPT